MILNSKINIHIVSMISIIRLKDAVDVQIIEIYKDNFDTLLHYLNDSMNIFLTDPDSQVIIVNLYSICHIYRQSHFYAYNINFYVRLSGFKNVVCRYIKVLISY